jgi:hypothetical protein
MKNGIPSEKYYFLLEWKDTNMHEFIDMYDERRMCDLTTYELNKLYEAIKAEEKFRTTKTKNP